MNRLIPLSNSPIGTPLSPSPINFEEAISRHDTPVQLRPIALGANAQECLAKADQLLANVKNLNDSLNFRLPKKPEYLDLLESIDDYRQRWTSELEERIVNLRNSYSFDMQNYDQTLKALQIAKSRIENEASDLQLQLLCCKVNWAIKSSSQQLDRLYAGFEDTGTFGAPIFTFLRSAERVNFLNSDLLTDLYEKLTDLKEKLEEYKSLTEREIQVSEEELKKSKEIIDQSLKDAERLAKLNDKRNKLLKKVPWARASSLKTEAQKNAYMIEFERRLEEAGESDIVSKLRNELKDREMLYRDEITTITGSTLATDVFKAMLREVPWSHTTSLKSLKKKNEFIAEFAGRLKKSVISGLRNKLNSQEILYRPEIVAMTGSSQAEGVFCAMFDIQTEHVKLKKQIEELEYKVKEKENPKSANSMAYRTVQRVSQHINPLVTRDLIDFYDFVEKGLEITEFYLKEVEVAAEKLGIELG